MSSTLQIKKVEVERNVTVVTCDTCLAQQTFTGEYSPYMNVLSPAGMLGGENCSHLQEMPKGWLRVLSGGKTMWDFCSIECMRAKK